MSTCCSVYRVKFFRLYNWASSPPSNLPSAFEYVPMLHGADYTGFNRDLAKFDSWGVKNVLSFNEPDMGTNVGGSNIAAADAARIHQTVFTNAVKAKYSIGSPAIARGSKKWLTVR